MYCLLSVPTCRHLWGGGDFCVFYSIRTDYTNAQNEGTECLERKENVCEEEKKFDEDTVDIGQKNQPVVQFPSPSASLHDATSAHHFGTPLNLGQFGTVSYQHIHYGHSQIAGFYQALSQYMLDQTLRHLYSTSRRHLLYLEQSFRLLLERFSPVHSIRDYHIQIPGITDRR